jgi:outer membrane protein assembly factor BamA
MTPETLFISPARVSDRFRAITTLFALHSRLERGVLAGLVCSRWLMLSAFLMTLSASAQEALRDSLAGDAAAETRILQQQSPSQAYTFKNGDFRMLITPALSLQWNDNVRLSHTNAQDDFIVSPTIGIATSYPLTQRNLLQLNVTLGYNDYLNHSDLSSWYLQSGSALSFDIYIKDLWINLHDQFSYVQDASLDATVANTGSYGTFQNTAGISGTWDLNDVTLALGYDHQNILSTSGQFDEINHAAELIYTRAGFKVHPKITTGFEATGTFTTYNQMVLNDNVAYTVGIYADVRPDAFFRIQPRVGYTISQFQHTSQSIQTSDQNSWYADLNITHQVTEAVSYSLDAGHEVSLGVQSDVTEDWFLRSSINWNIIRNLNVQTSFFYQHGNTGVGNVTGNLTETYDWYGGGLSLNYPIMKRFSLGLSYQLTLRSSTIADRGYTQNVVGLQLTYQP